MEYTEDKKAFLVGPIILKGQDVSEAKSITLINDKDETVYPAAKSSDTFPTDIKWRKATYYDMVWGLSMEEVSGITGEKPSSPNVPNDAITTIYNGSDKKYVSFVEGVYVKFLNVEYKDDDIDKDESDCGNKYEEGCEVTIVITKTHARNQEVAAERAKDDIDNIIKAKVENSRDIKVKNILYDIEDSAVTTYKGDSKKFTFTFNVKITSLIGDEKLPCSREISAYQLITSCNGVETGYTDTDVENYLDGKLTLSSPMLAPGMHIKQLMYCCAVKEKKASVDVAKTRAQELASKILKTSGFDNNDCTIENSNFKIISGPTRDPDNKDYDVQISYYAYIQPTSKEDSASTSGDTSGITSGLTGSYLLAAIEAHKDNKPLTYYYRIDAGYRDGNNGEKLAETNYTDNDSYGLNSCEGLNIVKGQMSPQIGDVECVSFADMAMALMEDKLLGFDKSFYDIGRVNVIRGILENNKITSIKTQGFASAQGYKGSNNKLAKQRGETIINWLKDVIKDNLNEDIQIVNSDDTEAVEGAANTSSKRIGGSVNDIMIKLSRCTCVTLSYRDNETISKQNEKKYEYGDYTMSVDDLINNGYDSFEEFQKAMENLGYKVDLLEDMRTKDSNNVKGYGKEYLYFNRLKSSDPFLFNQLEQKVKYFNPAYHSISPEGFTERLNFLQQCCRQGNTKIVGSSQANNLAFGRPPVCVLRIGDFFYTKVLINHLQIDYSKDLTWDLNPEGNGVQPMCAEVNMSFTYIGGSDIAGPVSRLQNALSFNHYANLGTTSEYAETQQYIKNNETGKTSVEITASKITKV